MLTRKVDFKFGLTSSASEENRRASLESGDLTIISVNFGSFKFGNVVDDERLLLSPTPSLSPPPAAMLIIISQTRMCLLGSRIQSGLPPLLFDCDTAWQRDPHPPRPRTARCPPIALASQS